jgi:hypothetical protein
MVVALKGAKKFRVATTLAGVFLVSAAGFFEVGAAIVARQSLNCSQLPVVRVPKEGEK